MSDRRSRARLISKRQGAERIEHNHEPLPAEADVVVIIRRRVPDERPPVGSNAAY